MTHRGCHTRRWRVVREEEGGIVGNVDTLGSYKKKVGSIDNEENCWKCRLAGVIEDVV